jgi:uncharacterized protein (UPF0332 family)
MKNEQREFIWAAKESLKGAEILKREELPGFAASRAYYAMFYIAKAYLAEKKLDFSKHSAVISAFGREFAATGIIPKEFHQALVRAQEARIIGDYLTGPLIPQEDLERHIENARKFLDLAIEHFGDVTDFEPE